MHIAITVGKIEKVNLPEFDDTFVKKVTNDKVATRDEFLVKLRTDLAQYWEDQSERSVADSIAATLVKEHDFPIPESIVNSFLDAFVDDVKSRAGGKKLPQQFDEEKFRNDSRDYAAWQAKWMLLKERIAEAEKITVTPEDVEKLAEAESSRIGLDKGRLLEYYKNSGSASERILSDKIMLFLRNNANVKEKVIEEPPKH
jgi:trigger factor